MKFSYYPGCSLEATAREYDRSARSVCRLLGIELAEVPDWSCCGASSAHSVNGKLAVALPTRTIAQAQEAGNDLVTPCPACSNRLKRADHALRRDAPLRAEMEELLGFTYTGTVRIYSLLEAVVHFFGPKEISRLVKKPLSGLKVVCYYGCLLVRPPEVVNFDRPENPVSMDNLVAALGAEVKNWSYKTECCGAHQGIVNRNYSAHLVNILLTMAEEAGAQALVVGCPLCQAALEMRRDPALPLPSFYFTELLELALGVPEEKIWFGRHLVDPRPLLRRLAG